MIRLDNVSKFYYSKGVIGVGFSKVSLNFDVGEFVAITGESGSGKSTLLNVISGLDSYEEGEMYVNGEETSHYTEKDFEDYRRKYIGNIFQNFNLVNSYTVYQNIELVMLLNGSKRKEIKARVNELIEKVGLTEYKNTKAAKLSGGQKQRVAIARALAKDTPIIIADEPTGNLDTESAKGIIELLASISKEKLVVIVTHNYDQVEQYVTRKIKMHDGKILEDTKFDRADRNAEIDKSEIAVSYKNIRPLSELRLGVRNAFNIPVKFLLCTFVFLFITVALICELGIFKSEEYENGLSGYNYFFNNTSENRIILKNLDEDGNALPFKTEDIQKIKAVDNVDIVVEQDIYVDTSLSLHDKGYNRYISGYVDDISNYSFGDPDYGRLPSAENEVLVLTTKSNYYISDNEKEINEYMSSDMYRESVATFETGIYKYKIVGVKFIDADLNPMLPSKECILYFDSAEIENIAAETNQSKGELTIDFQGKTYNDQYSYPLFYIRTSKSVEKGTCWVSDDYNALVKSGKALGETMTFNFKNPYYEKDLKLKISKIYDEPTFKKAYSLPEGYTYKDAKGYILVNPDDLNTLYDEPSYQVSVFVKDAHSVDATCTLLQNAGYDTLAIKDVLYDTGEGALMQLITKAMTFGLALVLLVIAYFVVRIILKSRNFYYSTIRMLGANVSTARALMIIDLLTDANIAYVITVAAFRILMIFLPDVYIVDAIATFVGIPQYIAIYVIVILIAFFVGSRYSKKLFEKSTMTTIKEEV